MPRKLPRNIQRVDHHHFHGYVFRAKRQGKLYERYFLDNGAPAAALRKAVRFRDLILPTLPRPRKIHSRSSVSKTGVIGVVLRRERTRKGTPVRFYAALWPGDAGRRRSRTFSVQKYGKAQAFALAVATRRGALQQLLRPLRPRSTPILAARPGPR